MSRRGLLLLFLDGVGIGPDDALRNPFLTAELPALRALLDGAIPTLSSTTVHGVRGRRPAVAIPLDATLDTEGTPQSGTGQATLLTGRNGAHLFGRHFGPWIPVKLRPMVEQESVLRRAVDAGARAAFANAYPRSWPGPRGSKGIAGPPLAARGAGLLVRHEEHLARGDAVASEIVNGGWRRHLGFTSLPQITPVEAGRALGRIAGEHDLTLFAHYSTDTVGHAGEMAACMRALERVDGLLEGVLETLPADHHVVVCSDHGNLEDIATRGHTRNPVLGLVAGPDAPALAASMASLMDVTPVVAELLGLPAG